MKGPERTLNDLSFEEKKQAIDDVKRLDGWPPYDDLSNICRADGYYAMSLEEKYGIPIKELRKLLRM